MMINDNNYLSS